MEPEESQNRILEYLKKGGPTNTFKLARELGIKRQKVLNIIKILEEKQALQFKSGKVFFLKFPEEEEKPELIEVKKIFPPPKKKIKRKKIIPKKEIFPQRLFKDLQDENRRLSENLSKVEESIKKLEKKTDLPPKIIKKTIIQKIPTEVKQKPRKRPVKQKKSKIKKLKTNFAKLNKSIRQLQPFKRLKDSKKLFGIFKKRKNRKKGEFVMIKKIKKILGSKQNIYLIIAAVAIIVLLIFWGSYLRRVYKETSESPETERIPEATVPKQIPGRPTTTLPSKKEEIQVGSTEETGKGIIPKVGSMIISPSVVSPGDTITIKAEPSGDKGFKSEVSFYPMDKELRIGKTNACSGAYCHETIEKEYILSPRLKLGVYYAKILDRDLNNYIYGYFTIV